MTPVGAEPTTAEHEDGQASSPVLLRDVAVSLRGAMVLDGIDLAIDHGTIVGVGGDNGAGKSTLLRVIAGLTEPDRGSVSVFGVEPRSSRARHCVGCAIDTPAAYQWMSARGHLRTVQLMSGADDRGRVEEVLRQFGLADARRKRIFRFSQGMRKRLALAQAALGSPRLLLLDEPTNALDPAGRDDVWAWVDARRSEGVTVIVVSHRDADRDHCDRWLHLDDGRLEDG